MFGGRASRRFCLAVALVAAGMSVFVGVSGATGVGVSWSAPIQIAPLGGRGYMTSVACPTASQCTAVDWSGQELTFDPQDPGSAVRHVIDAGTYGAQLSSVDCVSAQQCTAVEGGEEVTFDPVSGTVLKTALVAPITNLFSLSCPTATLCAAVGTHSVAFNPLTGQVTPAGVTAVTGAAVFCVSVTQCTSVDQPGFARTFDPTTGQLNSAGIVRLNGGTMTSVTCPTATECVGGDTRGNEIPFNPISGSFIGPGAQNWGMFLNTLSISCTSASACTSVDYGGGTRSFDPTTGTLAPPGETTFSTNPGPLQSVACLPAVGCVAVSSTGNEVTFDPATPGAAVPTGLDTARQLAALSCPSATQCTAVGPLASEVTFDPTTGSVFSSNTETLDTTTRPFFVVACPSTTQCTALLSPTGGLGDTVTFNPQTGAANDVGLWRSLGTGGTPSGIACPSLTECIAIDHWGDEVTFDPTTGVRWGDVLKRTSGGGFQALACPTTTQCTAVSTGGKELTWNPTDGSFATATAVSITGDSNVPFTAISCPSAVQCTGVGSSEVTFNPTTGVAIDGGVQAIDSGHYVSAISCPAQTWCVAVDRDARSVSFDPARPGAKIITALPEAGSLSGVACASIDSCAAIDIVGQAFSGTTAPILTPDTELTAGPADPTYTTHATFSFSSYVAAATFECNLDDAGWQACASPASYSRLSVGSHTFAVRARDGALSDPAPPTQTWTIQMSDVHIDGRPSDPSTSTTAAFFFSSNDSAATFECSLDGSPVQTCTSPAGYAGLSPGSHTFAVHAVNDNGVLNPTPTTATWLVTPLVKLKVTKTGTGTGTVTSSPLGILCGVTCSKSFAWGTSVTLIAKPARSAAFEGWSGGCSGMSTCIVSMNGAQSVTATFTHRCLVPRVVGKTLAAAKKAILAAVCSVGTITTKTSGLVARGYVMSQSPTAGKKLPDGTPVNLVISGGRAGSG